MMTGKRRLKRGRFSALIGLALGLVVGLPGASLAYTSGKITLNQVRQTEDTRPFRNCVMGNSNPNLLWCDYQNRRQAIDMSLCVPGSLRTGPIRKGFEDRAMICDAARPSGSFVRSCDRVLLMSYPRNLPRPNAKTGSVVYVSYCAGPKIKTDLLNGRKILRRDGGLTHIEYNRMGKDRRYRNQFNAHACPTHRFWNDLGQMRCSK
ncbi:MAG: hypothetical protein N4A61_11990 [Pelagimonas sp.]|nr:hypothetical protein [Pelagimonas sp.]